MNLAAVTAKIRPRTATEAMDLGVAMAREFRGALLRPWLLVIVPVAIVAWLTCKPVWAWLLVWWLKPLYDRIPLFVLSRALFGSTPRLIETLRALPRHLLRRALPALTISRFSPYRAFVLPVSELEGLKGPQAAARRTQLLGSQGSGAFWLLVWCLALEQCLWLAGACLAAWYSPEDATETWQAFFADAKVPGFAPRFSLWLFVCYVFALGVVEILYVAAGFALYLNRRTWLEGWDVELAFRRLAERAAAKRPVRSRSGLVLALALGALVPLLASSGRVSAQEHSRPEPKDAVRGVLESPDFATTEKVREPRRRSSNDVSRSPTSGALEGAALLLKTLLWIALALLVASVAWWLIHRRPAVDGTRHRRNPHAPPQELFGLDMRAESLPADPASEALRHFDAGDPRGALGLLYRAALAHLATARELAFKTSDTEGDCVERVRGLGDERLTPFFTELTAIWQQVAYAHATPDRLQVAALCAEHPTHFQVRP